MNLTDLAIDQFSQVELNQLAQQVNIRKDISRLDTRLQIDLIRYKYLAEKVEDTPLLLKFKQVMKIGVEEEVFNLESFEVPHCYGCFADCSCLLHVQCAEKLIDMLPHCYGVLYHETECRDCIVKQTCQVKGKELNFEADEVFLFRSVNFMTNLLMALAYFKSLYFSMPQVIKVHCYSRAFNIKRITRLFAHERYLPIDSFLMSGQKGEKPISRNPIILSKERTPVYGKRSI